jgi:hypothetical protein
MPGIAHTPIDHAFYAARARSLRADAMGEILAAIGQWLHARMHAAFWNRRTLTR